MNLIKTFSAMSGLSSVHRYSMMKLGNPESVLEHTGFVVVIANLIAREINELVGKQIIDLSSLTLKAIAHDVDELVVGDIPRPTKYFDQPTRDKFREIEARGVRKVVTEMGLSPGLAELFCASHSLSKSGMDGFVVSLADSLAVVYKVWEEVIVRNNMGLVRQAHNVKRQLHDLDRRAVEVMLPYDTHVHLSFVRRLISDAAGLMHVASSKDDPIHGHITEEFGAS